MLDCWNIDESSRPTFSECKRRISIVFEQNSPAVYRSVLCSLTEAYGWKDLKHIPYLEAKAEGKIHEDNVEEMPLLETTASSWKHDSHLFYQPLPQPSGDQSAHKIDWTEMSEIEAREMMATPRTNSNPNSRDSSQMPQQPILVEAILPQDGWFMDTRDLFRQTNFHESGEFGRIFKTDLLLNCQDEKRVVAVKTPKGKQVSLLSCQIELVIE